MSKDRLLSAINESEPVKEYEKNFDDARIEKIKKYFNKLRDRFSKPKIKENRRNFYEIKKISYTKNKRDWKKISESEKNLSKLKNCYDYDDIKNNGIRDITNLVDLKIEKGYYEPIITNSAFNNNYIKYESKGDKGKTLSVKECLNIIRPYLRDIISNHKTQGKWKIHSRNTIIDYKTQGEWKIQLTMVINFIISKVSDEIRIMHTNSNNVETMMGNETDEIIKELFESLLQRYQEGLEEKIKGSEFVFDSVDLLHYNLHKISLNRGGSYIASPEWLKNKKSNKKFKK